MKIITFGIILSLVAGLKGYSQDYTQTQNRIKSIYTYNFIKDINWPFYKNEGELALCLMMKNSFYDEFERLAASKNINGRTLNVIHIQDISECAKCDMIFIDDELGAKKIERNENCKSFIITSGFFEKGLSNIALLYQDKKLQFGINTILCNKQGYKISSHLSSLANQSITASK